VSSADLEIVQDLLEAADSVVEDALNAAEGRDLVIRLTLTGRGSVHSALVNQSDVDDIQTQINETWARQQPFAYCERVINTTSSNINRAERLQAEDFVGDLLRLVDSFSDSPQLLEELSAELTPLYGNPRASKFLSDFKPTSDDLTAILKSAEDICMDMLLEGE
jgi:hypothetical protein